MTTSSTFVLTRQRQRGYNLIEIMIALGIVGTAIATTLYYQSRAIEQDRAQAFATDMAALVGSIRAYFDGAGYTTVTAANLNSMGLLGNSLTYDASVPATPVLRDKWNNSIAVSGSATDFGFLITTNGAGMTAESCASVLSKLAKAAYKIHVGSGAAVAAGVASGGSTYVAPGGVITAASLASGCSSVRTASGLYALQFR